MTNEPTKRRFLTIEQAAEELNVRESLIRGLIKTGERRALQVGGRGYLARLLRLMRIVPEIRDDELPMSAGFCEVCKYRWPQMCALQGRMLWLLSAGYPVVGQRTRRQFRPA